MGLSRVSAEDILSRFRQFALETSFETIQFGYDGDPFARPERGIAMLKQLATVGKHINFSTKALLEGSIIDQLSDISCSMRMAETSLSAQISLSCWESASIVEPHTPSPSERILTVANLKRIDIPSFIAVRPVLPHIPDSEYERIAEEAIRAGCAGFIMGPLYADTRGQFVRFIPSGVLANVPGRTGSVSWSPHAPQWTRYEDAGRLHRLLQMIERKGGRTFLSSADAVALVARKEKIA